MSEKKSFPAVRGVVELPVEIRDRARRLRDLLKQREMSQLDAARLGRYGSGRMSEYLNGRRPITQAVAERLATGLGVTPEYVLYGTASGGQRGVVCEPEKVYSRTAAEIARMADAEGIAPLVLEVTKRLKTLGPGERKTVAKIIKG